MGVPLLVFIAQRGHEDIVRFLIEQRGHDPSVARADGRYTALHWATGLDLVRYLIEQGADSKALTSFGDSVVAQQIRSGQADVVDYLLGLGEERVSRANVLQWLEANPEMLRVLCRHGIALGEPIEPNFGEEHATLAMHRILQSGTENRKSEPGDGKDLLECVDILLAQGWDPNQRDSGGRLPYHMVQDLLPNTDDPLRQHLDARLSRFDGPRKRPRRKKIMNWF
jgi:ankyrin repeat protein